MTRPDNSARAILFAYPYARDQRDAVARYISDLRVGLALEGMETSTVELSDFQLRLESGRRRRLGRIMNHVVFYLQLALSILVAPKPVIVVTVDAPSAIGLIPQIIRRLSGDRVRDISWVMDLYRLHSDVPPADAANRLSIRARWELRSLRGASSVVTLGDCMRRLLAHHEVTGILTVPLWTTQSEVGDGHDAVDGRLRLLYSGSAREIHPLRALLEAATHMQETTQLRIAGRGTEIDAAAEFVQEGGLTNVAVSGLVADDDLARQYAWADVHVVSLAPSATGTCVPSKTYSAMGAGRAVLYIGDSSGQAAQDIRAAEGGVVVSADAAAILLELEKLVRDPSEVQAMGSRAAEFTHRYRSRSAAAERWSQILREWTK